MELLAILVIHALVTYCFARFVEREGVVIAFTWFNVGIAALTGNPFYTGIDIAAVFAGAVLGKVHKDGAQQSSPRSGPEQTSQSVQNKSPRESDGLARTAPAPAYREMIERQSAPDSDSSSGCFAVLIVIVVLIFLMYNSGPSPQQVDLSGSNQPGSAPASSGNGPASASTRIKARTVLPKGDLRHCRELATREDVIRCAEEGN